MSPLRGWTAGKSTSPVSTSFTWAPAASIPWMARSISRAAFAAEAPWALDLLRVETAAVPGDSPADPLELVLVPCEDPPMVHHSLDERPHLGEGIVRFVNREVPHPVPACCLDR